jgi:flavin-binding protein dodecin
MLYLSIHGYKSHVDEAQPEDPRGGDMSSYTEGAAEPIVKAIEMIGESPRSWEDAAHEIIAEAQKTLRGFLRVAVQDFDIHMADDHSVLYRVRATVLFRLERNPSPDYPMVKPAVRASNREAS